LIASIEIPARRLGKQRLAPGDVIELNSALVTHGRADKYEWSANLKLAD
jgi:hypothetical protein